MRRARDAARAMLDLPERLTVTVSESMVIITTERGLTTRLALDGSKVKDESTGIERRTRWEHDSLVSQVTGLMFGRATEAYTVSTDPRQLTVTLLLDGGGRDGRGGPPNPSRRVYDPEPRLQ